MIMTTGRRTVSDGYRTGVATEIRRLGENRVVIMAVSRQAGTRVPNVGRWSACHEL